MITIWNVLRHFKREEFSNPDQMDPELLIKLQLARDLAGIPFKINSSFRAGDPKNHGLGKAVDIECIDSNSRSIMVKSLQRAGFRRIILYPHHIHVDTQKGYAILGLADYPKEEQHEETPDEPTKQS